MANVVLIIDLTCLLLHFKSLLELQRYALPLLVEPLHLLLALLGPLHLFLIASHGFDTLEDLLPIFAVVGGQQNLIDVLWHDKIFIFCFPISPFSLALTTEIFRL